MFLRTFTPGPPLDQYVDCFWLCSDTPSHPKEVILPSGAVELVINLTGDEIRIFDHPRVSQPQRYSGTVVSGPYRRRFSIDPLEHASIMGVHFRPSRAAPILRMPVSELVDTHIDLEILWGPLAAELRERLCAVRTPANRLLFLKKYS